MPKKNLPSITAIAQAFPAITFAPNEEFYWSSQRQTVYYNEQAVRTQSGIFRLFHEIGHALCQHKRYTSGIQLVKLEAEAWEKAREIAKTYNLIVEDALIEGCLDSYRDWLHLRSTCPRCQTVAIESKMNQYRCFNCFTNWKVPKDQRSRQYRLKLANNQM